MSRLYPGGQQELPTATGCGTPVPVHNNPSYVDVLPSLSLRYALDNSIRLAPGLWPRRVASRRLSVGPLRHGGRFHQSSHGRAWQSRAEARTRQQLRSALRALPQPRGNFAGRLLFQATLRYPDQYFLHGSSGAYQGDLVSQWLNVSNAELYGFEVSYQQRLSLLPGVLGGLGMLANYSWTGSKVFHIPGRPDSPALQQQSPNTWNISPTYDRGRFSVRVGLSYNGPCIFQYEYQKAADVSGLGPNGPSGDVYTLPHLQLDAQASFRLGHGLSAGGLWFEPHQRSVRLLHRQPDLRQSARIL